MSFRSLNFAQRGFRNQARYQYATGLKPALDVFLVISVAIPALAIIFACALLIMLDGHNPFYSQMRVGKNGRPFKMWKLRSMVPNADAFLKEHLLEHPEAQREWDLRQKLKHDPRVTAVGRFMRKTSIDELPQLFNVFSLQMSLVGPRPMMLDQRTLYPGIEYYEMRPGITGYWQTSLRNESSFAERATYDASYLAEMSLATDLVVLARTVGVVLKGTGH
jgi:exopolysaccharide production protein ExoY